MTRLVTMTKIITTTDFSAQATPGAKPWQLVATPSGMGWFLKATHLTIKVVDLVTGALVPIEARGPRGLVPYNLTWYVQGPSTLRVERPGYSRRNPDESYHDEDKLYVQVVNEEPGANEAIERAASWTLTAAARCRSN